MISPRQLRNIECKLWRSVGRLMNLEHAASLLGFHDLQQNYQDARMILTNCASSVEHDRREIIRKACSL